MNNINRKKKVAVVMSSGYFGFFAHAGFLKAVEDTNITPHCFGGSSSGALVSAFAMSGYSADEIKSVFLSVNKKTFWDPDYMSVFRDLVFFRGFKGFLKGEKYLKLLEKYLVKDFESVKYPGIITGLDLKTKSKKIFDKGHLSKAVCASGLVPLLFRPMKFSQGEYLDGGYVDKAPLYEIYKKFKPDKIIVHVLKSKSLKEDSKISFSPLKLIDLCSAIGRVEDYKIQKEFVESKSVEVIEIIQDNIISVKPGNFENGKLAFKQAYNSSLKKLSLSH